MEGGQAHRQEAFKVACRPSPSPSPSRGEVPAADRKLAGFPPGRAEGVALLSPGGVAWEGRGRRQARRRCPSARCRGAMAATFFGEVVKAPCRAGTEEEEEEEEQSRRDTPEDREVRRQLARKRSGSGKASPARPGERPAFTQGHGLPGTLALHPAL